MPSQRACARGSAPGAALSGRTLPTLALASLCLLICAIAPSSALFDFSEDPSGKKSSHTCWAKSTSLPLLYHNMNAKLAEKASAKASPTGPFSMHTCSGSFSDNRACKFKNLYFNNDEQRFEYYVCDDEPPRSTSFGHKTGIENFTQPEMSEDRHLGPTFIWRAMGVGPDDKFPIVKIRGMPPEPEDVKEIEELSIIWPGHMIYRFGHMWMDNLYPIFMTMANFEAVTHDFKLFLMWEKDSSKLKGFHHYFKAFSHHPANFILSAAKKSKRSYLKWNEVIVGNQNWALTPNIRDNRDGILAPTHSMGYFWWEFRNHMYRGLNMDPYYQPGKHQVLLNTGLEKRSIHNPEETINCIKKNFPGLDIEAVVFHSLSVEEQLEKLKDSTIFISPEGSPSFRFLFQARGTTAIILSAPSGKGAPREATFPFHEADRYFDTLSYVEIIRYPILAANEDEYVFRFERSEHERLGGKERGEEYWRKWRFYDSDVVVKCEKLVPFVMQALIDSTAAMVSGL